MAIEQFRIVIGIDGEYRLVSLCLIVRSLKDVTFRIRISREMMSARLASRLQFVVEFLIYLLSALASGEAVRKIFTLASGSTTVPISLPSIITLFLAAISR